MHNEFVKIRAHGDRENMGITQGECECSEKADGANFSLEVEDGKIMYRSHHNILGGGLHTGEQWRAASAYLDRVHTEYPFPEGYIPFFECMTKHQIDYGEDVPAVLGIAVYNVQYDIYIKNWKEFFEVRGIPTVETMIVKNPSHELLMELANKKSNIGTADTK